MTRIALLGLGGVAEQIHLPACALLPDVKVAAGCDPDADRRKRMGQRFGIPKLYAAPEDLLEQEKPDIAIICAPPHLHRDLCLLALERGAHVLCEKPFVQSVAEADEVIGAAENRGLSVVVNNQYRFMDIYRQTREPIARGEYGSPFLIQCWQQMLHPSSSERNWRGGLAQYTLYEFGTHPLDLICYFFDDLPLSITAHTPHPRRDIVPDVIVQATVRFPGERLATLMFNRISHAPERYLEMRIDCERASIRISFGGLARAAVDWSRALRRPVSRFSMTRGGEARVEAGGRSKLLAREWSEGRPRATASLLREMIEAVKRGKVLSERATHARELIRIVSAGYESARTGETVWLRSPET